MDHAWGYGTRTDQLDGLGVFELEFGTVAIVCDGKGGPGSGSLAVAIAVRAIWDALVARPPSDLEQGLRVAIAAANLAVHEAARKGHRPLGWGCSVVVAVVTDRSCFVGHVGDARAYLVRSGAAQRLTRDHTMVNLFVDAELLSPEDAATHPEAQVLSRSLGAERQVEIEIGPAVRLERGDAIVLSSAGVHATVSEGELGHLDWGVPQQSVEFLLELVEARSSEHAAAVAVFAGTSFEDVPETPLPRGISDERDVRPGVTAVPDEEPDLPSIDPRERSMPPAPPSSVPDPPGAARVRSRPWRAVLPVVLAANLLLMSVVGAGVMVQPSPPLEIGPIDDPDWIEQPGPPVEEVPPTPERPTFAPTRLFDPAPPRLRCRSVTPVRFRGPPPGGPHQYTAVTATRMRDCPTAMDAVQQGMQISVDHAVLYRPAWLCFNEANQRRLVQAEADSWPDFAYLLEHFEGAPEAMRAADEKDSKRRRFPRWYRKPVGGIEYRLERYIEDEQMVEALVDRFGECVVADHLARDVYLEGLAAAGLSRVPAEERTPALVDAWARRVYVTARALHGRPGRAIAAHGRELLPLLRQLLDEATTAPEGGGGSVPAVIRQARAAGEGAALALQPRRRPATHLVDEIEKELERLGTRDIDVFGD